MRFIELTDAVCKRTAYVRADFVSLVMGYSNDDKGERCTRVWFKHDDDPFEAAESQEEVLRRLVGGETG